MLVPNSQLLETLLQSGSPMCAGPAQLIFEEDDPAEGAYITASGCVSLSFAGKDGAPLWSHTAGPGTILSLAPALAGLLHIFTAVTFEETVMRFVGREELRQLILDRPNFGVEIVCLLSAEEAALRERWSKRWRKRSTPGL